MEDDYKVHLDSQVEEHIEKLRSNAYERLNKSPWSGLYNKIKNLNYLKTSSLILNQDKVSIGNELDLSTEEKNDLKDLLIALSPWKKGPFSFFGFNIDSEWQSHLKWNRITPYRKNLHTRVVGDIGCNNGYYMFRMAAENPAFIIGFEPHSKLWLTFQLLQKAAKIPNLYFEPFGLEYLKYYPNFFDTIFCLGILYHHTDPVKILKDVFKSLKKGGELIIDCQGISGDQPIAYIPETTYAGARGTWFLPTQRCLEIWIKRAGFISQNCFYKQALSVEEQRRTKWAPIKSLKDHLDPHDLSKTIEGHPAPWRFYIRATKI